MLTELTIMGILSAFIGYEFGRWDKRNINKMIESHNESLDIVIGTSIAQYNKIIDAATHESSRVVNMYVRTDKQIEAYKELDSIYGFFDKNEFVDMLERRTGAKIAK